MEAKKLKDLKPGAFFTRKPIEEPKENQVYLRGAYDRAQKKYECTNFGDMNKVIYLKGETIVYQGFTF